LAPSWGPSELSLEDKAASPTDSTRSSSLRPFFPSTLGRRASAGDGRLRNRSPPVLLVGSTSPLSPKSYGGLTAASGHGGLRWWRPPPPRVAAAASSTRPLALSSRKREMAAGSGGDGTYWARSIHSQARPPNNGPGAHLMYDSLGRDLAFSPVDRRTRPVDWMAVFAFAFAGHVPCSLRQIKS